MYAAEDYCIKLIVFDSGQGHTPLENVFPLPLFFLQFLLSGLL